MISENYVIIYELKLKLQNVRIPNILFFVIYTFLRKNLLN